MRFTSMMSRKRFLRPVMTVLALALPLTVGGQPVLEIVPLRHRTADQVLPALRLLLEPGATLSAHGNQVIMRASPGNVAELKQVLAEVDRPLRRLQISVRFEEDIAAARRNLAAGGRVDDRGARIELRAGDTQAARAERVDQRVQVLEGGVARIAAGKTAVIAGTPYGVGTGFHVVPRLSGEVVFLDVATEKAGRERQGLATTVSGRLGEWLELGGADRQRAGGERGLLSESGARLQATRQVWLKVEELP
jgi:hypothetical protein